MSESHDVSDVMIAWKGGKPKRTPVWLMRQAGRYLPEYRALREKAGGFLNMVYDPKTASEITLQPLSRFDLDAAIIFSDILVVPQAMGQNLRFAEGEGPILDPADFTRMEADDAFSEKLAPVYEAIGLVRSGLARTKALIGFAGGPFTLASYMIEGSGGHDFAKTKAMIANDRAGFARLIDKLVQAVARHLQAQIKAGVDAVQIFESHAGQLQGADFAEFIVRPTRAIVNALNGAVPVIGFARQAAEDDLLRYAVDTGITAAGIDQHTPMHWAVANMPPRLALQGNLDPEILRQGVGLEAAVATIKSAAKDRGFVFNLGHGVIKDTPVENVAKLVELVHT